MNQLEADLKNLVANEIVEVAWHADYPINQGIGLWSFIEAFKKGGFSIDANDGKKKVDFFISREVLEKPYEFHSQMSFDQISRGWGGKPRGSPRCLYDSICAVYDLMEREKFPRNDMNKSNLDKRNDWYNFRNSDSKKIRRLMEEELKSYFEKYQEHLFIPVSGNIPQLASPRLIHRIMKDFPCFAFDIIDAMKDAEFLAEERGLSIGPCAETILEESFDFENYNPNYYPSESTLIDLFLGKYLHRFSLIKGYNTWGKDNSLREFVVSRHKAFIYGSQLDFPYHLKNEQGIFY